jgi:hypothetical protein
MSHLHRSYQVIARNPGHYDQAVIPHLGDAFVRFISGIGQRRPDRMLFS